MVSSQSHDIKFPNRAATVKTEELNQWIRKVKSKKIVRKRATHGEDLRVLAMLTQALRSAEQSLRQKQVERAQKWAKIKSKLEPCNAYSDEEEALRRRTIDDLWSSELNGLNDFMNSLHQVKAS